MQNELKPSEQKSKQKLFIIFTIAIILITAISIFLHNSRQDQPIPQENTFYLATKENDPILFYRYPDLINDHNNHNQSPSIGHLAIYNKPYDPKKDSFEYVDFNILKNTKKIFTFEGHAGIENYILSEDKKYLLLSIVGGKDDATNYIYQIDLQTQKSKKVWEHTLKSGMPPYNGGIAHLLQFIPNHYIVFAIIKGNYSPEDLPIGVVISNMQSGKEKVLGVVGNTHIDLDQKLISFRKFEKTQVPCEKNDPVCFATDTYKYVYKPGGETLIQSLP